MSGPYRVERNPSGTGWLLIGPTGTQKYHSRSAAGMDCGERNIGYAAGLAASRGNVGKRWYVGAMNDGLFIIDQPPSPAPLDHVNPDRHKDAMVIAWSGSREDADRIVDAHNAGLAARGGREAELVKALERTIRTANLLLQNSIGCARVHHGVDLDAEGMPDWLADCEADIKQARALLTPTEDREYQIAVEKLMKEPG